MHAYIRCGVYWIKIVTKLNSFMQVSVWDGRLNLYFKCNGMDKILQIKNTRNAKKISRV